MKFPVYLSLDDETEVVAAAEALCTRPGEIQSAELEIRTNNVEELLKVTAALGGYDCIYPIHKSFTTEEADKIINEVI